MANAKTIVERGASWTLDETKLLLQLYGRDLVERRDTNHKRTKETYDLMAQRFKDEGYDRTADQIRTRIFNMIAEYRRLLKEPNPERIKKCIFFEALQEINAAKNVDDVMAVIDNYEDGKPGSNPTFSEKAEGHISDSEAPDGEDNANSNKAAGTSADTCGETNNESDSTAKKIKLGSPQPNDNTPTPAASSSTATRHSLLLPHSTSTSSTTSTPLPKSATNSNATGMNPTPTYININSTKLPIFRTNQLIGTPNGHDSVNGIKTAKPTPGAITGHQLYQAPVNTFDVTSSALLIDRMFAHLSRESENMREWIALEKERIALEKQRRAVEIERETRRERVLIETLMKFQEQWISFLSRLDPRLAENAPELPPEIRAPPQGESGEPSANSSSLVSQTTQNTQNK